MANLSESSLDELRLAYKPDKISVLFVGESPPANGTFFYEGDSNLHRYTARAFFEVYGVEFSVKGFLDFFKDAGCYLEDIWHTPMDRISEAELQRLWGPGIGSLPERIRAASPRAVISVIRRFKETISDAARASGVDPARIYSLPFPAMSNQQKYVDELVEVLNELRDANILPASADQKPHA